MAKRVVLIDNYDSFTYNLYEYLCQAGAEVLVYRNDEITIPEIEALNPTNIMISPGPGHPKTDSGISIPVINHFKGKVPIYGVCMGLQCIVEAFGGTIASAGEIIHGKTSAIQHNNMGTFRGVPQNVSVTRYHSLAASLETMPDCLEVTATSDGGMIQGVRHKEFTIEAVQFHPESVISEGGHTMIRNFVELTGTHWNSASASATSAPATGSILDRIYAQRRKDVEKLSSTPGFSFAALEKSVEMGLAPKQLDFVERLRNATTKMALLAEVKRASPSKGEINIDAHAASQALTYAEAGAAAISVLTEPHWFKGDIEDLRQARLAVSILGDKRPAILRKEFVFSKYQILEARLYGADTVLLIVKMLSDELLKELYDYSLTLKMEPLVEVASLEEMKRAVAIGSKVIGVNNRDLHSFAVDMSTTSNLVKHVSEGTILCALSGIAGRAQVDAYEKEGVKAVLVGESLMRAEDPSKFVHDLVG